MKTVCGLALTTVLTLGLGSHVYGTTYFVDARQSTSGGGTTWATAKKSIQEVYTIQDFGPGDVVHVAGRIPDMQADPPIPGLIYTPTNQTSGYIQLKSGVRIEGGFRGNDGTSNNPNDRDPATFVTILSGNLGSGVYAHHVVKSPPFTHPPSSGGVTLEVNLDGVTIRDGKALFSTNSNGIGAGIYIARGNASGDSL